MNHPLLDLDALSDEALLQMRICDLRLDITTSGLESYIQTLYQELATHDILFRPECYFADEWMCPDLEPVIGIPFFLGHPRLRRLEKKMVLEVEGDSTHSFMKLLRHECGHAINYAYRFYRKKKWRSIFGPFNAEYPDTYRPRPYSRRYVRHLENGYAQYHPDEDFAETFAVWLTPGLNWQEEYKGWPAIKKLRLVDEWMRDIAGVEPPNPRGKKFWDARKMKTRLANYYAKKKKTLAEDLPGFYNPDLQKIFSDSAKDADNENAAGFLWRKRREITNAVALWTGRNKFTVNRLLKRLIQASKDLQLHLKNDEVTTLLEVSNFMTTRVMNYLYTGTFKIDKRDLR